MWGRDDDELRLQESYEDETAYLPVLVLYLVFAFEFAPRQLPQHVNINLTLYIPCAQCWHMVLVVRFKMNISLTHQITDLDLQRVILTDAGSHFLSQTRQVDPVHCTYEDLAHTSLKELPHTRLARS